MILSQIIQKQHQGLHLAILLLLLLLLLLWGRRRRRYYLENFGNGAIFQSQWTAYCITCHREGRDRINVYNALYDLYFHHWLSRNIFAVDVIQFVFPGPDELILSRFYIASTLSHLLENLLWSISHFSLIHFDRELSFLTQSITVCWLVDYLVILDYRLWNVIAAIDLIQLRRNCDMKRSKALSFQLRLLFITYFTLEI